MYDVNINMYTIKNIRYILVSVRRYENLVAQPVVSVTRASDGKSYADLVRDATKLVEAENDITQAVEAFKKKWGK
jgi:molybdenum-dependent DNA-binding transcriptional regulator ModE